jgi:hypothetical protein
MHSSELPQTVQEMDFLDSSFFQSWPREKLPTPAETRALSPGRTDRPLPVIMEHLNLLVKFGPHVIVAESQCLWFIRRTLGDIVPVPEIYGWRTDGPEVFLYMQLIRGVTLKQRWDYLSIAQRTSVCRQFCGIISTLRQIKQHPSERFIGTFVSSRNSECVCGFSNLNRRICQPPNSTGYNF